MRNDDRERTLPLIGRDIPFTAIEGELCKVLNFGNLSQVVNGKVVAMSKTMPYGYIEVVSKNLPESAMLMLTHKDDYLNIWEFMGKQDLPQESELLIIWTDKNYKKGAGMFKAAMPKLWVLECHKGYYEFSGHGGTLDDYKTHYDQTIPYHEFVTPIADIKPDVME